MNRSDTFQTYEMSWDTLINALRKEMTRQVGADIIDNIVCDLKDGFEVYTYIQGDLAFEYKEALERKYGTDSKIPNILTVLLLATIYNTKESNIRLHADQKENPVVEVYVKE